MKNTGTPPSTAPSLMMPVMSTCTAIVSQCGAFFATAKLATSEDRFSAFANLLLVVGAMAVLSVCAMVWWIRYFRAYFEAIARAHVPEANLLPSAANAEGK